MLEFASTRHVEITPHVRDSLRTRYTAEAVADDETIATISRVYNETGRIIDPHTAVAVAAAERCGSRVKSPMVILATAHPAKFPEAVKRAIGRAPELPPHLAQLMTSEERCTVLPSAVSSIRQFVLERTRTA
jgi:threonine synthase